MKHSTRRNLLAELQEQNMQLWQRNEGLAKMVQKRDAELAALRARVAKLEAAQEWKPADDPPLPEGNEGASRDVEVQLDTGTVHTDRYHYYLRRWHSGRVIRWRELPPAQEDASWH